MGISHSHVPVMSLISNSTWCRRKRCMIGDGGARLT
jgi:hypothetical protein